MINIVGIDHVAFTSDDADGLATWYGRVFDMERRFEEAWSHESTFRGNPLVMCNGDACVSLFRNRDRQPLESGSVDQPDQHFALKVNRENFELMQDRFRQLGIEFQFWDHKICHSVYVVDPDGHQVEVTTYEVQATSQDSISK